MSYYERPDFKVIIDEKPFQVRYYESFYVVMYSSEDDRELRRGFQTLFKYISKNNEGKEKISMTAPVIESKKEDTQKMSFILPKALGDSPPKPMDPRLKVIKIEAGNYAVISYRGNSNSEVELGKEELLMDWIDSHNWSVVGDVQVAYFNPPFIPGLLKHNEIMVKIEIE